MKNQFEKHIQDAMKSHELPVSDSVWASIQQKQSKKPLIYYVSRVSAACLLLFLGFFTFSTFSPDRQEFNTIVIEEKGIPNLELELGEPQPLQQVYAALPPLEMQDKAPKVHKSVYQPESNNQTIELQEREVIVLNIKTRKKGKRTKRDQSLRVAPAKPRTHVDSEILVAQIEERLSIENKKELKSYLTDIKKLASKNSINNKIQTAQNWIVKTASDFGINNKKHKNND